MRIQNASRTKQTLEFWQTLLRGLAACALLIFLLAQICPAQGSRRQQSPSSAQGAAQTPAAKAAFSYQFAMGGNVAQTTVEVTDGLTFLPVRVNGGPPSWFLLDTARPDSAMDDLRAAELGLAEPSPIGGRAKIIENPSLQFPGLKFTLPSLSLDSFSDWSSRVGRNIQGILGEDVLSHFVEVLNYQGSVVQFYEPRSFQYSGHGDKLKMEFIDGAPAADARVNVRDRGTLNGLFKLVTGQSVAIEFAPAFAAAHNFSAISQKTIPYTTPEAPEDSAPVGANLGRVRELQIEKFNLADPLAVFPGPDANARKSKAARKGAEVAGSIGGAILERFIVVLDAPQQTLFLEPNYDFPDLFTADMSGLDLVGLPPDFHSLEVVAVAKDSPAAAAKIAAGDMLVEIDGQPADDYSLNDVRSVLRQQDTEHQLTFKRGDKTFEVKLKLKPRI